MSRKKMSTTNFYIKRMRYLSNFARGFICCISRKGVIGENTDFNEAIQTHNTRCRSATSFLFVVDFGIKEKAAGLQHLDDFQPSRAIFESPLDSVLGAEHLHQAFIFDRIENLNKVVEIG